MSSMIPSFYRIFFTIIDPMIALAGALTPFFMQDAYLKSFSGDAILPAATETRVALDIMAGFFAAFILLQVFLLRARPTDVVVWRYLEASLLITDIAVLGAYARVFAQQQRMHWSLWRAAEWGQIIVIAPVTAIRVAFLTGVGMQRNKVSKRA